MKLMIQIPCYNEEQTLGRTLDDLPRRIKDIDCIEYVVINDGSTDSTEQVARSWGVHHVVTLKKHEGLGCAFKAGIDFCLSKGADIVVNTDADHQYRGSDIEKLVQPILCKEAEIVIGERPIEKIEYFSDMKKRLQILGSGLVKRISKTDIPDVTSGLRAYSRSAAMNVIVKSKFSYTIETIIRAGYEDVSMKSIPIQVNPYQRKSRLCHNMCEYIIKSTLIIVKTYFECVFR